MPQIPSNKERIEHSAQRNYERMFWHVCANTGVFRVIVNGDNKPVSSAESSHASAEEPSNLEA